MSCTPATTAFAARSFASRRSSAMTRRSCDLLIGRRTPYVRINRFTCRSETPSAVEAPLRDIWPLASSRSTRPSFLAFTGPLSPICRWHTSPFRPHCHFGIYGHTLLLFELFSFLESTCRFAGTCKPDTFFDLKGTMWSTS